MFKVVVVSVNGGESTGQQEFVNPPLAQAHVERELRGLTSYWRVWIENSDGERVVRGTRSGPNGTGNNWEWVRVP